MKKKNKKNKKNIFTEKTFIIGIIIIILIVLIPNLISLYNIYTPIKVNEKSKEYYKEANELYKDSKNNIENICHNEKYTKENVEYEKYTINKEYQNHKDSQIINKIVCEEIGENLIVHSNFESLQKKNELKNKSSNQVYYAQLDTLYNNKVNENQYKYNLENTDHEIIYNYLISIHKLTDIETFNFVKTTKINAKKEMLNNYNLKLKYEIEELRFINNTIKYFNNYLNE